MMASTVLVSIPSRPIKNGSFGILNSSVGMMYSSSTGKLIGYLWRISPLGVINTMLSILFKFDFFAAVNLATI